MYFPRTTIAASVSSVLRDARRFLIKKFRESSKTNVLIEASQNGYSESATIFRRLLLLGSKYVFMLAGRFKLKQFLNSLITNNFYIFSRYSDRHSYFYSYRSLFYTMRIAQSISDVKYI